MKIIHCADLHLDSALSTNLPPVKAQERNAELLASFARMVQFAVREQVRSVLIAGDLFDSAYVSARTVSFVAEQIKNAENVAFFYLRGNHDEQNAFDGIPLPPNLKTFGKGWTAYPCGDVVITGMELEWEKPESSFLDLNLPEDQCNIVMLHGQITTQPGIDQIPLPALRNKNIDYLALGHIHSYQTGKLDHRGLFCYSGCLEGRGFDECGEKGFVLLETDGDRLQHRFIPFASRILHEIAVDISKVETVTQILSCIKRSAEDIPAKDLVRFTLAGACPLQTQKDTRFLQKMLESDFWFVKIKDESTLKIERESYEFDASLKGAFIRSVMASGYTEAEQARIITCGIRALNGEEVVL